MLRRLAWVAAAFLVVTGFVFANGQQQASAGAKTKNLGTFYELYQSCPSNPFWIAVNNGGKAAAAALGINLKIEDPLKCSGEIAQENSLLTTIINSHPAGIAVSVVSTTAFAQNIQRARRLHIPIVAYNSLPAGWNPKTEPVEAYVGQNNYAAGVALGKRAYSLFNLQAGDTVVAADSCVINATCHDRYDGLKAALGPKGVNVVLLNMGYDIAKSEGIAKSYFQTKGTPAAVLAFGSATVQEIVLAAKALNISKSQLPIGSFDDDAISNKYMLDGWLRLVVDQQPFLQGYDAVVDLYSAVVYKQHPINMSTGPEFVQNTAFDRSLGWLNPSVVKNTGE